MPWKRGGGGGCVLGYYDNPGFKRGSSLTSSINLAADNLDFVINDDDLEPGIYFTSINLSPVIQAFEYEILSHLSHYSHMTSTQSQSFLLSAIRICRTVDYHISYSHHKEDVVSKTESALWYRKRHVRKESNDSTPGVSLSK